MRSPPSSRLGCLPLAHPDVAARCRLYRLRLQPQGGEPAALTSIPARCLVSPACREQLDVHVAADGSVIALNYAYPLCPCTQEHRRRASLPAGWQFAETVPAPVWTAKQIAPLQILPKADRGARPAACAAARALLAAEPAAAA